MNTTSFKLPPIKTLVVGGGGYIGSHMLLALQDAGQDPNDILVFDNTSRGHADACGADPPFQRRPAFPKRPSAMLLKLSARRCNALWRAGLRG